MVFEKGLTAVTDELDKSTATGHEGFYAEGEDPGA